MIKFLRLCRGVLIALAVFNFVAGYLAPPVYNPPIFIGLSIACSGLALVLSALISERLLQGLLLASVRTVSIPSRQPPPPPLREAAE